MKSYTDIEQSKKLAEILPIESADSHYVRNITDFMGNSVEGKWSCPKYGKPKSDYASYIVQNFSSYEVIPCWSLAALLNILPKNYGRYTKSLYWFDDAWHCEYVDQDGEGHGGETADNPIDACYEMIIKLNERKLL